MPYLARVIGAGGMGIFSYTNAIAYYFVLIAALGISNYGNRSIAAVRDNPTVLSRTFWEIYAMQLLSALFLTGAYVVYVLFFVTEDKLIVWLQMLYVLTAAFDISWFYFGIEQVKHTVFRNTAVKVSSLILIFLFVKSPAQLWLYVLISGGGQLLGFLSIWLFLKKYVDFVLPAYKGIIKHLKPNLTLFIPVIAVSLYTILNKIMLGAMSSKTELGYFTYALALTNLPMALINALGIVVMPRVSNLVARGKMEQSKEYIEVSLLFSVGLGAAMSFGIAAVAPVFVPLYYGDGYEKCILLLGGLSLSVIFMSWAHVIRTQFMLPHTMDFQYIISVFGGAAVNIGVNLFLIGRYGAWGAVIANILAEAVVCLVQTVFVRKSLPLGRYLKNVAAFISSGFVMYFSVRALCGVMAATVPTLLLLIAAGALIYCALVVIQLRCFRRDVLERVLLLLKPRA